jgi:hypothetical protein
MHIVHQYCCQNVEVAVKTDAEIIAQRKEELKRKLEEDKRRKEEKSKKKMKPGGLL